MVIHMTRRVTFTLPAFGDWGLCPNYISGIKVYQQLGYQAWSYIFSIKGNCPELNPNSDRYVENVLLYSDLIDVTIKCEARGCKHA